MTHELLQITIYGRPGGGGSVTIAREMDLLVRRSDQGCLVTVN